MPVPVTGAHEILLLGRQGQNFSFFSFFLALSMVHPAIIAAIIGAAVVAGVVTYYYIDDHYNHEYDLVGATRRPRYHTVSDSDSEDEGEGFNPRAFLKRAGLRRRHRHHNDERQDESFGMVSSL
jgi:hypothetical protein